MTSTEQFKQDVDEAFSSEPKRISSKYFYDDQGSKIFQAIMSMQEYYLTDCEMEIFETQGEKIIDSLFPTGQEFDIVELGAGDGLKTKVLLKKMLQSGRKFSYRPIDISKGAIDGLVNSLKSELPDLQVNASVGEYFQSLEKMSLEAGNIPKLVLFLGSTLGNFRADQVQDFLCTLRKKLRAQDYLLIGIDLKKDPHVIRQAYDDPHGITRRFNLNLLSRINRELDADIQVDQFGHYQSYEPFSGEVKSYIFSKKEQEIHIGALNKSYSFGRWEMMHTETSKKYSVQEIKTLAEKCGFQAMEMYFDCKHFYSDSIWKVK